MARRIVECVPNFSEGRRADVVDRIAAAALSVKGVRLLDKEMDQDHNRSVLTFAGEPEAVVEAAIKAVGQASLLIDLNHHKGVHPRIGAADVVPFIPVENITLDECALLAEQAGEQIWKRYQIPVYLYGAAAKNPERAALPNLRKGAFEGLREEVKTNPEKKPDFGDACLHPTAGAVAVGARKFLIAYNFHLETKDVKVAKSIAAAIRESSGGLASVRALGLYLESRKLAQVSVNLTDYERTSLGELFHAVEREATKLGVKVKSTELIGLVPRQALDQAGARLMKVEHFREGMVLENRLLEEFPADPLADFLTDLSPGRAAAATAAMAAAVGEKMARISGLNHDEITADKVWLAEAAVRDAVVFDRALETGEEVDWVAATRLPIEVATRAHQLVKRMEELRAKAHPEFQTDVESSLYLCRSAIQAAITCIQPNLSRIQSEETRKELTARIWALQ